MTGPTKLNSSNRIDNPLTLKHYKEYQDALIDLIERLIMTGNDSKLQLYLEKEFKYYTPLTTQDNLFN